MNKRCKEIFDYLFEEVVWLNGKWKIYQQLFLSGQDVYDVLNNSASTFFFLLKRIWLNELISIIMKITDSKTFKNNKTERNISLDLLISLLDEKKNKDLIESLNKRLEKIKTICKQLRFVRNKIIAHHDLNAARKINLRKLQPEKIQPVEDAVKEISELYNEVEKYFLGYSTAFDKFAMQADGNTLVSVLKKSSISNAKIS